MAVMCQVLGVTRQGYYAWTKREPSAHALRDLEISRALSEEYAASRCTYGAPKLQKMLMRRNIFTSRKRIARLMKKLNIRGITRGAARRGMQEKRVSRASSAPDLIKRSFSASGPNEAWFADITYVRTHQGWMYLALVMDVWSRMIVGWSMKSCMSADLADDALKMAIARRRPKAGCVHHSDHGAQYASVLIGKTMREAGIRPSMGSVASPWDNAITETLMGVIKAECIHAKTFNTRDEAALEIFEYIEGFYNRRRIHSAIEFLSPAEFEEQNRRVKRRPQAA